VSQAEASTESDSSTTPTEKAPNKAATADTSVWSARTLAFAQLVDPDPALSSELEYVVQRSIDAKLDRSTNQIGSVTCRGNECQMLFTSFASVTDPSWPPALRAIISDLNAIHIRNPTTGADLKPSLELVSRSTRERGYMSLITFK
jgi:hypothetical protein